MLVAAAWVGSVALAGAGAAAFARRSERRRFSRTVAIALAHDLRTPLARIRMSAEMLGDQRQDGDARRRWLDVIERESRLLGDRVGALLLLAGGGGPVLVRREADLAALLRELVAQYGAAAATRGVALELVAAPVTLEIDPQAVRQAAAALLDAALAATPEGGTLRVELADGRGDARVTFAAPDAPPRPDAPPVDLAREVARMVARAHGGSVHADARGYVMTLPRTVAAP